MTVAGPLPDTNRQQVAPSVQLAVCWNCFPLCLFGGRRWFQTCPHCGTRLQPSQPQLLSEPNCFRSFCQFLCPNSRVCSSITSSGLVNVGCAVNCHWLTNRRPMKHPMELRLSEKLLQLQRRKTKGREGGDRKVMMEGGEEMIGHAWLADL